MAWKLCKNITAFLLLAAVSFAATGDITSVAVNSGGDTITVVVSGFTTGATYNYGLASLNTPSATTPYFTVVSKGFDATGSATTITRTVYVVSTERKAYPSNASNNETGGGNLTVLCRLSENIYQKDAAGGGNSGTAPTFTAPAAWITNSGGASQTSAAATAMAVTNNSTLAYPKPIGHFVVENRRPVDGTALIEAFATHKFAKDGKPLACMKFTVTGGSSSTVLSSTVTSMTKSTRDDQKPVYAYSPTINSTTSFTRGEAVAVKFQAYPWVGDSILDSNADGQGTAFGLTDLAWTYMTPVYAAVDSGGNDTSGIAHTNQTTAEATPCLTIAGALTKIAAYNNSNYTLNRCDGGVVVCKAGSYSTVDWSAKTTTNGYWTLTHNSTTNRGGVLVTAGGVVAQSKYERMYDITLKRASNVYLTAASTSGSNLVMEKVALNDTQGAWYSGDVNTSIDFLDCASNNSQFIKGLNDGHARLVRNYVCNVVTDSSQPTSGNASCVFGCRTRGGAAGLHKPISTGAKTNLVVAFNECLGSTDGNMVSNSNTTLEIQNCAFVGNLFERIGTSATPIGEISGSSAAALNLNNLLFHHNTWIGQRFNHENDLTGAFNSTFTNWGAVGNIWDRGNHEVDVYSSTATQTGAWAVDNSTGFRDNHMTGWPYGGVQRFYGLRSNTTGLSGFAIFQSPGFVNDSVNGATSISDTLNVGVGNYAPSASSVLLSRIASGTAVIPYDLYGNPVNNTGSGAIGAVQPVVSSSSSGSSSGGGLSIGIRP